MNEVFETLADVFEELRSESEDREFLEDYMDAVMPITRRSRGRIIRDLWTVLTF